MKLSLTTIVHWGSKWPSHLTMHRSGMPCIHTPLFTLRQGKYLCTFRWCPHRVIMPESVPGHTWNGPVETVTPAIWDEAILKVDTTIQRHPRGLHRKHGSMQRHVQTARHRATELGAGPLYTSIEYQSRPLTYQLTMSGVNAGRFFQEFWRIEECLI